jgi:hypothetical protein
MPGALLGAAHVRELVHDDRVVARVLRGLPEIVFPEVERVYYAAEGVRAKLQREGRWPS